MGRDTKAELQKCLRHNTALMAKVEAQAAEIERLRTWLEVIRDSPELFVNSERKAAA